ncbi:PREDICTED: uncharacterized protein LOC105972679 [Erythranthe guttata]|uniref:uncharacterized protein LOC105972679 n=1 Tax=Erythranthe guttata TaxID=4155 RepID=UPI00064DAD31|nr:PREDICTED: uncharacterized protein LOC105972679 [Erythranthe guttata]|eukprot:XP_012853108.1 PREDICTED: uncharacterized protein LOC105972679 [Erythranthe guttata]
METKQGNNKGEAPLLLISQGDKFQKHIIYSLLHSEFRNLSTMTTRKILSDKKVLGSSSSYGWLGLVQPLGHDCDCCLFNPVSKDKIDLPKKLDNGYFYNKLIMTKPPTEPDCYIIFSSERDGLSFCRIGDEEYVTVEEHEIGFDEEDGFMGYLMAIVCFRGKIYGFIEPDKFVTINFVDKSLEYERPVTLMNEDGTQPWFIPRAFRGRINSIWLIKSCSTDELLLVLKTYPCLTVKDSSEFRVFSVDTNAMTCMEVENIGNRSIFVTLDDGGYCCPTPIGIKPNSIYYTNIRDRNYNVFDLEDRSKTSMPILGGVAVWSKAVWVQPQMLKNFMHQI